MRPFGSYELLHFFQSNPPSPVLLLVPLPLALITFLPKLRDAEVEGLNHGESTTGGFVRGFDNGECFVTSLIVSVLATFLRLGDSSTSVRLLRFSERISSDTTGVSSVEVVRGGFCAKLGVIEFDSGALEEDARLRTR